MPESYHRLNINYGQIRARVEDVPVAGHVHCEFEVFFLLAGKGSFGIERNTYPVKPGDVMIINNSENHQGFSASEKNSEYIQIHFDPDLLSPFSQTFNLYHCFFDRPKGEYNKLVLNKPQQEKIMRLFNRIKDLFEHPFYADEVLKYTALIELIFYINRLYLNFSYTDERQNLPEHLANILDYIDDNIQDELSLDTLEKKFYINRSYLGRLFQKYLNISVHEYIIFQRIAKAKELLLDGYNALDASKKSGFNDYSNFRKMFKKITRVSPSAYIKKQYDENMNCGPLKSYHRQFGHTSSALPDLIVTGLSWSPENMAAGDLVTFTAVVKNIGRGAVPIGIILGVGFKVDDFTETWSDNYTLGLSPGESVSLTANTGQGGRSTWAATVGAHRITAHVDDIGRITESDTENNQLIREIVVG
jgi:AraC-like DNA-binding protein